MYCLNCGAKIQGDTSFCTVCSRDNRQSQAPFSVNLRGFSPRINDPIFAQYIRKSSRQTVLVMVILAFASVLIFYIAGAIGLEKMSNPTGLFIGLVFGGLFLIIALIQSLGRKRSKTWDGTVENKEIKKKTRHQEDAIEKYLEYSLIIRSDSGKKHVIKSRNDDVIFQYFNIGDRVRHHAGLKTFEKYDKSGDRIIPCNACGVICDIKGEFCFRCKCPLLK